MKGFLHAGMVLPVFATRFTAITWRNFGSLARCALSKSCEASKPLLCGATWPGPVGIVHDTLVQLWVQHLTHRKFPQLRNSRLSRSASSGVSMTAKPWSSSPVQRFGRESGLPKVHGKHVGCSVTGRRAVHHVEIIRAADTSWIRTWSPASKCRLLDLTIAIRNM